MLSDRVFLVLLFVKFCELFGSFQSSLMAIYKKNEIADLAQPGE